MSVLLHCDRTGCEKTVVEEGWAFGWFKIVPLGPDSIGFEEGSEPKHYCGPSHLAQAIFEMYPNEVPSG